MADAHHKPETDTPTTKSRRYTVGYIRDSRTFEPSPSVTLKGQWLEEVGFETGTPVDVRVLPGCLILTAREPQPESPEPEVLATLRKACSKLSARKQRQISEFIQVIAAPQKRAER